MKYLLILFTLTLIGSSINAQVKIDFNELKKADSKEDFVRICLSNGFELIMEDEIETTLAYDFSDIDSTAVVWAYYHNSLETFEFKIYGIDYYSDQNSLYQNLIADIKKCNYVKTFMNGFGFEDNLTYVLYSCPSSAYKGKIGFCLKTEAGKKVGRIQTFDDGYIDFCEATRENEK